MESISATNTTDSSYLEIITKAIEPVKPKPVVPELVDKVIRGKELMIYQEEQSLLNSADGLDDEGGLIFGRKNGRFRVVRVILFSVEQQQWVTRLCERHDVEDRNYPWDQTDMENMFRKYNCQTSIAFRDEYALDDIRRKIAMTKFTKAQFNDMFSFCACNQMACKGNAQISHYWCMKCSKR